MLHHFADDATPMDSARLSAFSCGNLTLEDQPRGTPVWQLAAGDLPWYKWA